MKIKRSHQIYISIYSNILPLVMPGNLLAHLLLYGPSIKLAVGRYNYYYSFQCNSLPSFCSSQSKVPFPPNPFNIEEWACFFTDLHPPILSLKKQSVIWSITWTRAVEENISRENQSWSRSGKRRQNAEVYCEEDTMNLIDSYLLISVSFFLWFLLGKRILFCPCTIVVIWSEREISAQAVLYPFLFQASSALQSFSACLLSLHGASP